MDELTARLQRAAAELAERAVVPAPDDVVRRGRRRRRWQAAGAVLLAMALAGGVVVVPLLRPWQPAAPGGMPPAPPSTSVLAPGHRCPARATTTAQLTANNITFAPACLAAVAGKPFRLTFDNKDAVVHNVSIFAGPDANSRQVFTRPPFRGPRVETYQVPALQPGRHFFRCDVHPSAMQGRLIVR
jgi:plastocyanin